MPSSSDAAVHLRARAGAVALRLSDAALRPVAEGIGELSCQGLPPGLYLLEIEAGHERQERFLTLAPGQTYEDLAVRHEIASPTPMGGTRTNHAYHARPASELSREPSLELGSGSRLLLFARHLEGNREAPVDLGRLELLDQELEPLIAFGEKATVRELDGWAGTSIELDPGFHLLRERPSEDGERALDQPLWLAEGWLTAIFLACPAGEAMPRPGSASIHMAPLELGFEPWDDEVVRVNLAAELALTGLRSGQPLVPKALFSLLEGKFKNPMLGLLGAHAMLLSPRLEWALFDQVIANLERLVPGHPDVTALRVLGRRRLGVGGPSGEPQVFWPPMFASGYRALLAQDVEEDGLLPAGSLAERAAASLLTTGPWTRFGAVAKQPGVAAVEEKAEMPDAGRDHHRMGSPQPSANDGGPQRSGSPRRTLGLAPPADTAPPGAPAAPTTTADAADFEAAEKALRQLLAPVRPTPGSFFSLGEQDTSPALDQVRACIDELRTQAQRPRSRVDLDKLQVKTLATRLGLPLATVRRAVTELANLS